MYSRGLKTSLIINLFLVLSGAMLLIDLVMISTSRRDQINERMHAGYTLLSAVQIIQGTGGPPLHTLPLSEMLRSADVSCVQQFDGSGVLLSSYGDLCPQSPSRLRREALKAIDTGHRSVAATGGFPMLFWTVGSSLVVAVPGIGPDNEKGALAASLSLASISRNLWRSQQIFLIYFLINLFLFIMLGFFRLYRTIVRPIDQLVGTAEEFRDDNEFAFLPISREGEFNRLANALNLMLGRINRDRTKVAETVASLERANQGLRRAQQEIIRAEKMASVGRLSAGIAHEIGNPIGIIIGYLELLKHPALEDGQKADFIRRAEGEASRVNTIIRQLLDFARSSPEDQTSQVSVHELLAEVREMCRVQPLMSGISLELECRAENDRVMAGTDHLKQVFLNLLLNAADAIDTLPKSEKPGRIFIRTTNIDPEESTLPNGHGFFRIEFIDNGPGFDPDQLDNVFDPFYTTKEPGKGTGLGLSISFSIIESMGGEISAANSETGGGVITIVLPLTGPLGSPMKAGPQDSHEE